MKCVQNTNVGGAHLQCVNNHYAKLEYNGGVTDYTNQTPLTHFGWKKCLSSTPIKNEKIFIKCAQNGRCTLQSVNNHYAKFEYKIMKTVGVIQITQTRHHLRSIFGRKMSKFNTPQN